jgi:hypothetical protein
MESIARVQVTATRFDASPIVKGGSKVYRKMAICEAHGFPKPLPGTSHITSPYSPYNVKTLTKWRVVEQLGAGGMSLVNNRQVAPAPASGPG